MTRTVYRLVALCLALVWGPATMCCALETAGLDALCSDASCHENGSGNETTGGCCVLEDGNYQSTVSTLKVAPSLTAHCVCFICVKSFAPELEIREAAVVSAIGRPRDWVPIWQFERRAAAPAHAPDSLIA